MDDQIWSSGAVWQGAVREGNERNTTTPRASYRAGLETPKTGFLASAKTGHIKKTNRS
jgi:hypothetical protein